MRAIGRNQQRTLLASALAISIAAGAAWAAEPPVSRDDVRPISDLQAGNPTCEAGWEQAAPLVRGVTEACSAVHGGKIYVFGDNNSSAFHNTAQMYDPKTDTWTQLASMPTGRGQAAAAAVNDRIYVIGGNSCLSNCWRNNVEAYDIPTNTWVTNLAPLPGQYLDDGHRGELTAVALDGMIYVMGGGNSYTVPTSNETYRYDPASNSWAALAPMPIPRSHHAAVAFGGRIWVAGGLYRLQHGCENIVFPRAFDVYDPSTNAWTSAAMFPLERMENIGLVATGDRIYAIGGTRENCQSEIIAVNSVVEYHPYLDCWTHAAPLPFARAKATAAVSNGESFMIGGANRDISGEGTRDVVRGYPLRVQGDMNGDGAVTVGDIGVFVARLIESD